MNLEPGLTAELTLTVAEEDTAHALAAHQPRVLSTTRIILMFEKAAYQAVLEALGPGQGVVGTLVNMRHLAATPIGLQARFRAELAQVDGRRLLFQVDAWDQYDKVAEGVYESTIIDRAQFDRRIEEKAGYSE